jgi:hypothetical protein
LCAPFRRRSLDALRPRSPITGMLLDRTRAHLEWGAPLELRDGQCVLMFVSYDTGSDESRGGSTPRSTPRQETRHRWGDYMAVETRDRRPDATRRRPKESSEVQNLVFSPLTSAELRQIPWNCRNFIASPTVA